MIAASEKFAQFSGQTNLQARICIMSTNVGASQHRKKQRRFRWLGHVLRMPSDSENHFALGTTRETKALTPLRRTIQTESQD